MRILFVASLHHPQELEKARRNARQDPLFPPSQGHYFWVRALRAQGHECAVFWRSASAFPWVRPRQLRMSGHLTLGRALSALAARFPRAHPDFRLRNRRLLRFAEQFAPDVVILTGDNRVILPQTLAALKKRHSAALIYACGTSPIVFSQPIERAAAPLYDMVVANDLYHAMQWRELGTPRVEVLPLSAVDPDFHRPYTLTAEEQRAYTCEVGVVGTLVPAQLYSERVAALEALRDFDLGIWSVHDVPPSLKPYYRGAALGEQMLRITGAAKIVVNVHGNFMRWGGNMRLFEACGVGAFQIADDRPGVAEWFTVGEHLVTFRNPQHLRELVAHYLAHADERARIAEAGRAHVHAHHTYAQRMARLMNWAEDIRNQRKK